MVRIFVSDRIFVDNEFCNGGIVVNNDGKVGEILKTRTEVDEWLKTNGNVEVNTFFTVSD